MIAPSGCLNSSLPVVLDFHSSKVFQRSTHCLTSSLTKKDWHAKFNISCFDAQSLRRLNSAEESMNMEEQFEFIGSSELSSKYFILQHQGTIINPVKVWKDFVSSEIPNESKKFMIPSILSQQSSGFTLKTSNHAKRTTVHQMHSLLDTFSFRIPWTSFLKYFDSSRTLKR